MIHRAAEAREGTVGVTPATNTAFAFYAFAIAFAIVADVYVPLPLYQQHHMSPWWS